MKKYKIEEIVSLYEAVSYCADYISLNIKDIDPDVSYALARNLRRLKPGANSFYTQNQDRINAYSEKDEHGLPMVVNGQYSFGENKEKADSKYMEIISEDFDFEPYTIKRSKDTDKLPPKQMSELLDIIIIE